MRVLSVVTRASSFPGFPRDGPGSVQANHVPTVRPHAPAPVSPSGAPPPFARLLRGLAAEIEGGEGIARNAVSHAARAKESPGPLELLALQEGVYRYSEALDLAARLVDRAATSVKTVLQGQ
ncbi:MAG: hypothetical protein ACRENE_17280 [Polyangiaceae bacterium]